MVSEMQFSFLGCEAHRYGGIITSSKKTAHIEFSVTASTDNGVGDATP